VSAECALSGRYSESRWSDRFKVTPICPETEAVEFTSPLFAVEESEVAVPSLQPVTAVPPSAAPTTPARVSIVPVRAAGALTVVTLTVCACSLAAGWWFTAAVCGFAAHLFGVAWLAMQATPEKPNPPKTT
jgi:hypothetical protein